MLLDDYSGESLIVIFSVGWSNLNHIMSGQAFFCWMLIICGLLFCAAPPACPDFTSADSKGSSSTLRTIILSFSTPYSEGTRGQQKLREMQECRKIRKEDRELLVRPLRMMCVWVYSSSCIFILRDVNNNNDHNILIVLVFEFPKLLRMPDGPLIDRSCWQLF